MTSNRKHSFIERTHSHRQNLNDNEQKSRRTSISINPLMNKIKPFIYGSKNDNNPDYYNRVRYIRDACKVLGDLWKTDKDFLNKMFDNDVSKLFKEFRLSEIAKDYRSPYELNGAPSILNQTIDDLIQIHDYIDLKKKESFEQFKRICEQAKDKQTNIRQTINELRENYEKAQKKLETADSNLKKFQTRSDRLTLANFEERLRELEDTRTDCEQNRTLARDLYVTEVYKYASEEHSITVNLFFQYLSEQNYFYNDISKYLSTKIPDLSSKIDNDELIPSFGYDLDKHCSKRYKNPIAYPIDICIHLLKNSLHEEGLFRIAPSIQKQKKFVAQLDLQYIDKGQNLYDLNYDPHVPAATLKQYLRELPDCLLTSTLLTQWNQIPSISGEQARVQRIGQLINQLPKVNYDNLCYLVRFLSRVAENSSENKMTSSNLGICIGCSILYSKEVSSSTSSISNSYTSGSTILELMINHHKQLFPNNSQQDFKIQPDIIPIEFNKKIRSNSNENLLDTQSLSGYSQSSPSTRRKNKAPLPPAPPPPSLPISQQQQQKEKENSNENLTGNQYVINKEEKKVQMITSKSNEESSSSFNQAKNVFKRFPRVTSSSSFTPSDKIHRRTPSDGIQLDRPGAPPPLPPSVVIVPSPTVKSRQRYSVPLTNNNNNNEEEEEGELYSSTEDKLVQSDTSSSDISNNPTSTNNGVNVGKLISQINNRTAALKFDSPQTNNNRSSFNKNTNISSPGETTNF